MNEFIDEFWLSYIDIPKVWLCHLSPAVPPVVSSCNYAIGSCFGNLPLGIWAVILGLKAVWHLGFCLWALRHFGTLAITIILTKYST